MEWEKARGAWLLRLKKNTVENWSTLLFMNKATSLSYGKKWNEHNEALWCHNIAGWEGKEWAQWSFVVSQHCCMGRNRISTKKLCGFTTLLDRKKYNEALWYYKTVAWEEKEWGQWSFVVPHHCCMGRNRMSTMKLCGVTTLLDGNKKEQAQWSFLVPQHCLYDNKWNEYNEALWCHSIVLPWWIKLVQWRSVVSQHCCIKNRLKWIELRWTCMRVAMHAGPAGG